MQTTSYQVCPELMTNEYRECLRGEGGDIPPKPKNSCRKRMLFSRAVENDRDPGG